MKLWKKIMAVVLTVIVAGALFACGNGGDGNENPSAEKYTVTYDAGGGALSGDASVSVEAGKKVTLPVATLENCALEGWYSGSSKVGNAGDEYAPTATVTLTAHYTLDNVQIAATNKERAVTYAKNIRDRYWHSDTKLSNLTPEGGRPYLWPYTEQLGMVNGILGILDKTTEAEDYEYFSTYLTELIEGIRHYRVGTVNVGTGQSWNNENHVLAAFGENDGTANSYAIYNSGRNDNALDSVSAGMSGIFFDDNIWVAKEFYYAYINLGEEKYLNEAINIVNWIVGEGYETTKGLNGIYWKWGAKFMFEGEGGLSDDTHASLNACSSAPTSMMLGKLYQVMTDSEHNAKFGELAVDYLSKAQNIFEFCRNKLMESKSGCLCDKVFLREGFQDLPESQQIQLTDAQILPYNTGTYMTAGAELYNIAVAQNNKALANVYKSRNTKIVADADKQFANTMVVEGQYSYNKNSWFTSFILDGFIDIAETGVDASEYIEHMRSSLDYGYKNFRNEKGLVSPAWVAGWGVYTDTNANSEQNAEQILYQSANAHCYAMLVRYYGA